MRFFEIIHLMEISDKVKTQMREKFKQQDSNLTDQQIDYYLNKWDKFSSSFPVEKRDITRLSFNQVEQLIDTAEARQAIKGRGAQQEQPVAGAIYDKDNLVIFKGDARPKCIQYGQGYSWCISRNDSSNLYTRYRFAGNNPVFYFVFDKDRVKDDELHAVVIHVDKNNKYQLTTSRNDGDHEVSWEEITRHLPKLARLKSLFKPQPITDEERSDYLKYGKEVSDQVFSRFTYAEKAKYIEYGNELSEEQQNALPYELLATYAKQNPIKTSSESMNRLKSSDFKYVVNLLVEFLDVAYGYGYTLHYYDFPVPMMNVDELDEAKQEYLQVGVVKDHPELITDPRKALIYADYVLLYGFPAGEPTIAKDSASAYYYALNVIEGEWPEGEPTIAKDPEYAYEYALNVIDGEWPEAEKVIARNASTAYHYAVNILERRWPEAEPVIEKDPVVAKWYAGKFDLSYDNWHQKFEEND
jgi:hypothetical protein